jgi:simple sugar transport system ATP-binding protein
MRGITTRFGRLVANDAIDLDVARGEIHAIVGENGAGKSTLMRTLYGMNRADAGTIELGGVPVTIRNPAEAIALGIGMVHQRFQLVDSLTALENLALGRAPSRHGVVFDREAARAAGERLAAELGTRMAWDRRVRDLSVGDRQRLEIMRLLYRDADVLILDEPTSVLTPGEVDELFVVLRRLAASGRTILFVTHKLREVFAVAGWVTLLRGGKVIISTPTASIDPQTLATMIVGERLEERARAFAAATGSVVLRVEGLAAADDTGRIALQDAGITVRAGEIVGIAGVEGSGQRELVETLVGLRRAVAGEIALDDQAISRLGVRERRALGLGYISADRDGEGACRGATIAENVIATAYRQPAYSRRGWMRWPVIARATAGVIARFGVRGGNPDTRAGALSGGNLQRVVVGRELSPVPRLLVAAHPTRGVDLRGIAFIHQQLAVAREAGTAVLLVSGELTELLDLADRVLVLFAGRIVADLPVEEATPERLGALMTGVAA